MSDFGPTPLWRVLGAQVSDGRRAKVVSGREATVAAAATNTGAAVTPTTASFSATMRRPVAILERATGGLEGPPVTPRDLFASYLIGGLILPAAICLETAVSFAISAARCGAFTLTLP